MSDIPAIRYGLDKRPGRPQPERYIRHGLTTATAPAILPAKVPSPEVARPPRPETRQAIADRLDSTSTEEAAMSPNTERVRKAVASRGFAVESLEWEPVYNAGEMMGYGGGWSLTVSPGIYSNSSPDNDLYGMSVEELLAQIDYWCKPEGECACDRSHNAITAAGIINDPKRPTHGPACEWHIPYRLAWWPDAEPAQRA